jgi:hypothetical protein
MLNAAQSGADPTTLRAIQTAATPEEAITAASVALGAEFANKLEQQKFNNSIESQKLALQKRAQGLDEAKFAFQRKSQQEASAGNIVTATTANDLTSILGGAKVAAGTKTNLADILGVMSAAETMAKNNPTGTFPGISPFNKLLDVKIPFTDKNLLPFRETLKSKANLENAGYIDGINLKVQQWASGASLTAKQIEQVARMTPTTNDSDSNVKIKLNNLSNFMNDQIKGALMTEGITYAPPKVDLFNQQKPLSDILK